MGQRKDSSCAHDKTKNIFLYFFTKLKTYHLSNFHLRTLCHQHCWSKQYVGRVSYELNIRPGSPWSLCGSVVEHLSMKSEGLRFNSSWGLRIFSLSHTRDKTKKIFLYFFTEPKTHHLSNFYLQTICHQHCWS